MGIFSSITSVLDRVRAEADRALEAANRWAEEARRKFEELKEAADRIAEDIKSKVKHTADSMEEEVKSIVPNMDGKVEEVIHEVAKIAESAISVDADIVAIINNAIAAAIRKITETLNAAIDAITRFLSTVSDRIFKFLEDILPGFVSFLLEPLKSASRLLIDKVLSFADSLKEGIKKLLQTIESKLKEYVKEVAKYVGPIWNIIKQVWKTLFGEEPEEFTIAALWFEERMKRTEKQLLENKESTQPITAVIRKEYYFEVLPPDENAWKSLMMAFLDQDATPTAWRNQRPVIGSHLAYANPDAGKVLQLTWDTPVVDKLGGHQRVQISVIYYRWRTAEFRKFTAGFLHILAMISATGDSKSTQSAQSITVKPPVGQRLPLEIDEATKRKIYDTIKPHLRLKATDISLDSLSKVEPLNGMQLKHQSLHKENDSWES